jgi:hypothetical protein
MTMLGLSFCSTDSAGANKTGLPHFHPVPLGQLPGGGEHPGNLKQCAGMYVLAVFELCHKKVVMVLRAGVFGCGHDISLPGEMQAIDANLLTKPELASADQEEVAWLRTDGKRLRKAG